jgi:hypothetical protein
LEIQAHFTIYPAVVPGLVADYLAAPKKKQKSFIVMALGAIFSESTRGRSR